MGRALRELGIRMIPAYSPQARGRSERNFSTWQGRLPQELRLHDIASVEAANVFLRQQLHRGVQPAVSSAAGAAGTAFLACRRRDLNLVFCVAVRAHGESRQHGQLSESVVANGAGGLAGDAGGLPR